MPQTQISPTRNAAGKSAGIVGAAAFIVSAIFAVEGGYVNDKRDPGGETNFGVTKAVAVDNGFTGDMRKLTKEQASQIAYRQYIVKPGFAPLIERDPAVAQEVIDTGYNAGTSRAAKWFQESLNHLNNQEADYADLVVDGQLGPSSLRAYDTFRKRRGKAGCRVLIKMLDAKQALHYMQLFSKNSKFEAFAFGWFDHRIGNVDLSRCGE